MKTLEATKAKLIQKMSSKVSADNLLTIISMKENGKMDCSMEQAGKSSTIHHHKTTTKVSGAMAKWMDKELCSTKTEKYSKEHG